MRLLGAGCGIGNRVSSCVVGPKRFTTRRQRPMSTDARSTPRILPRYSVEPTHTDWIVAGHTYDLLTWSRASWARLPDRERPDEARPIDDGGWAVLRLADDD